MGMFNILVKRRRDLVPETLLSTSSQTIPVEVVDNKYEDIVPSDCIHKISSPEIFYLASFLKKGTIVFVDERSLGPDISSQYHLINSDFDRNCCVHTLSVTDIIY